MGGGGGVERDGGQAASVRLTRSVLGLSVLEQRDERLPGGLALEDRDQRVNWACPFR